MELFRSEETGELVFSSYMSYEEEFSAYIHQDDTREFYMDDDELEHGLFHEVDPDSFAIYKEWCHQESLKENDAKSLFLYFKLLNSFGGY
jgi:hypothetical protein